MESGVTIMSAMDFAARQQRLANELRRRKLPALLLSHMPNIRYLCGFTGSSGLLLFICGTRSYKAALFTDGRYTSQAAQEVKGARVVITKGPGIEEVARAAGKAKLKQLGFESEHMPYSSFRQLSQALRPLRAVPVSGTVEQLRAIKDPAEVEQIRAAVLFGSSLFQPLLASIRPGAAESMVAGELEFQARKAGAEGMSFDTIVAAGARSALPHGRASAQPIPRNGFIILDYGVILAGYCSDMTRTVHLGSVSPVHHAMYQAVLEAQLASIQAVAPGVETGEVDRAGREILTKAGYAAYFTHSTGHGVGIEVHEQPRLAKGQKQKLEPGMVVTIEPGIYLPEEGGVRIEDMVLVTESGHEVLTPTTKELITL
jgi:Xaa-Pro aminopeptidase